MKQNDPNNQISFIHTLAMYYVIIKYSINLCIIYRKNKY
jgi:hypothetical protein